MVKIDGSYGEGGGQILRTALSLAALLREPVEICNIRAKRGRPGLRPQHLVSAEAVCQVSQGNIEGGEIGSPLLRFYPGRIRGGRYSFRIPTAGSTGMVLQTVLPLLSFSEERSKVGLEGGTHTAWSPPVDYIRDVFLPTLREMGIRAELKIGKWGWYPRGQGRIEVEIEPVPILQPFYWGSRGELQRLKVICTISNLPLGIAQRETGRLSQRLKEGGYVAQVETIHAPSVGKGTSLLLTAEFGEIVAGFEGLGERGKRAEEVADEVGDAFFSFVDRGGVIDPHLADQLIIYMALADGESSYTTTQITRHLLTNIWVVEEFLPLKFEVGGKLGEPGQVRVEGIGFRADSL